jgi:hypothetical protein
MVHAAIGFGLAALFTAALIWLNPSNLGTLLAQAPDYPLPTLILWYLLGLTCSSCQMGAAIMLLGSSKNDPPSGKFRVVLAQALRLPARVVVKPETLGRRFGNL